MPLYRLRLRLCGPFATPFSSGSLFGQMCWAKRRLDGQAALQAWLDRLPSEPWALSDALPAGFLPRPALPVARPPAGADLKALDDAKKAVKRAYVPLERWRDLRVGLTPEGLQSAAAPVPEAGAQRLAHNTIDRRSGRTPETAGLWFADEFWPDDKASLLDLYVEAPAEAASVRRLVAAVGEDGFGRDAAFGRGQFTVEGIEDAEWLAEASPAGGTAYRLSLSHGVLSPNMEAARYRLFPHFGKVGRQAMAEGARPWKRPLLLTRPGAVFRARDGGPFGAWLIGVHEDRKEIGHNAFHLAIPFTWKEQPA
jgi:CRISPR-associated protein Csm4